MELGGHAPFIVFDNADLNSAVEGVILSKFRASGQTCICANRILVQDGIYEQFAERLSEEMDKRLKIGNGFDEGVTQGPLISLRALDKVYWILDSKKF